MVLGMYPKSFFIFLPRARSGGPFSSLHPEIVIFPLCTLQGFWLQPADDCWALGIVITELVTGEDGTARERAVPLC